MSENKAKLCINQCRKTQKLAAIFILSRALIPVPVRKINGLGTRLLN